MDKDNGKEYINSNAIEQVMSINKDLFTSRDLRDNSEFDELNLKSALKDSEKIKKIVESMPDVHNTKQKIKKK